MPETAAMLGLVSRFNGQVEETFHLEPKQVEGISSTTAMIIAHHLEYVLKSHENDHIVSVHWILWCKKKLVENQMRRKEDVDAESNILAYNYVFDQIAESPLTV